MSKQHLEQTRFAEPLTPIWDRIEVDREQGKPTVYLICDSDQSRRSIAVEDVLRVNINQSKDWVVWRVHLSIDIEWLMPKQQSIREKLEAAEKQIVQQFTKTLKDYCVSFNNLDEVANWLQKHNNRNVLVVLHDYDDNKIDYLLRPLIQYRAGKRLCWLVESARNLSEPWSDDDFKAIGYQEEHLLNVIPLLYFQPKCC